MRTFPWIEPDDTGENWGYGGCFECAEEEVANQTAILMARFHLANQIEKDLNFIPKRYEQQIWPWNTRLGTGSKYIVYGTTYITTVVNLRSLTSLAPSSN